jgi:hypothetical protein
VFWRDYGVLEFTLLVLFLVVLATLAFMFVRHQLLLRRSAGEMFKACSRLANKWLTTAPDVSALQPVAIDLDRILFVGFTWPEALVSEMKIVQAARTTRWWARDLTYAALISSGLIVALRLVLTWKISAEFIASLVRS